MLPSDPTGPEPAPNVSPQPTGNVNEAARPPVINPERKEATLFATAYSEPASQGTPELAQIFQEHYGRVFRVACRITGNPSDAEDVLQTVFLRLVRREPNPEAADNLDSYLYRAAINASLDILRARKQRASVGLEDVSREQELESASVPDTAASVELQSWLRRALARLAPRHAEMFALRYFEGYENREIAQLLNTSAAVVAVTLHRTRTQLEKDYKAFRSGGSHAL
ncbi:MAG TPA: RNA polymerase sigma factor [Bryobacteraceae bacterium]|nr:RNA polymerase sigma factor [Bryobacteraceae bacterium]